MSFDKTITYAIVKGQEAVAHEAIRAIWDAYFAFTALGTGEHYHLSDAIKQATSCLPDELRTPDMPAARPWRDVAAKKDEFDDILG